MTNEELVYLYRQGDKQALEKLLEQNTGMLNRIVNKYYTEGTNSIDREDLVQEGYMGLMAAANKYDFNNPKKAQFITYAIYWVNQRINRFVKTRCTNEEISLNTPKGEDGDMELLDYIEGVDYSFENVEEQIYRQQLRKELEELMLNHNTLKEREILKLHYGWDSGKCMTLQDIGELYDVTRSRIQNIEIVALRKLRQSKWGRIKAEEYYIQKRKQYSRSIPGTVESISFAQRYLL
jgi:RNA polymerase primary sigma factor/RNA polymerase sporulation-specific sigma factor